MSGWIKIHRKFDKWEWRGKPEMVSVFLHMLTQANFEPTKWQGITVERGQVIFGRNEWSRKLGISPQSIRSCLVKLKSTNEITIKSTNRFSIITIVNYEEYQSEDSEPTSKTTSKSTNNQPAINQQLTTPKELKNLRTKEIDSPEFHPDVPNDVWDEFLKIRKKKKAQNTAYALSLLVAKINKLKQQGFLPIDLVNQSILNSWVDVFPIRPQGQFQSFQKKPETRTGAATL